MRTTKRSERKGNNGEAEKGKLIKGAATIAMGGLVAKLIGAVYRIPLTNLIGGEGIGLYQLVYPFYCLLLTVSATGIPSSIAALTARKLAAEEEICPLFKTCMRLFLVIGGVSTAIMVALAPFLAKAQGESASSRTIAVAKAISRLMYLPPLLRLTRLPRK